MNYLQIIIISFFVFILCFMNCNCLEETIDTKDLNELTQCFYQEKNIYGENEEITYEIINNNNLDKTLFIQFKSIDSLNIYQSNQDISNIIFSQNKEENNYGNYYFILKNSIKKYYIKINLSQNELDNYKICFNLFEGKGNSFKAITNKSQKVASYDVINSGKYPFYINDDLNSFTALRINKKYEKYFSFNSYYIKAYIFDSDEVISFHINELYNKGEYQYIIWNLDINNNQKIKEIIIEVNLNLIENEENFIKFEMELIKGKEIHYGYTLNLKKFEQNEFPVEIYYINLRKYLFKQDLDILFLSNNIKNEIFISNSDNIKNENIIEINKKFMIINQKLFEKNEYKNINPYLLLIIIDESFIIDYDEEIFYNFNFVGSSHDRYNYKENIKKEELFQNNKILIKSNFCKSTFYINYFNDIDNEKIIEYESILGKTNLCYSNKNDLSNNLDDYILKIDSFPITNIKNAIMTGDYGIMKMNCLSGSEKIKIILLNLVKI